MPLHPSWGDIVLRLVLTLAAGGALGLNRGARGHAAGLRTTMLVALAAAVAMIQANLLLPTGGKTTGGFATMDVMRMPLGILTGVGFIGGGAILKRGDLVLGVTTAATLWMATVIGLCFGGGQIGLGFGGTAFSAITLWSLKRIERRIPRDRRAVLVIRAECGAAAISSLVELLAPLGFRAVFERQSVGADPPGLRLRFRIAWRRPETAGPPLDLMALLDQRFSVLSFEMAEQTDH